VVSAFFLAEPTAGNGHDTCLFQHLEAVQEVRLAAISGSVLQEFISEVDSRERIHGSFNGRTSDIVHRVENFFQQDRSLLESIHDTVLLL